MPEQYHPIVAAMDDDGVTRLMQGINSNVENTLAVFPGHRAYAERYCKVAE